MDDEIRAILYAVRPLGNERYTYTCKKYAKENAIMQKDKVYNIVSSHITVQLSLYSMITKLFRSTEINQIRFQTVI